jgi:hypothetical protein
MAAVMTQVPQKSFSELDGAGKVKFFGKLIVFLMTFGFAFPKLLAW